MHVNQGAITFQGEIHPKKFVSSSNHILLLVCQAEN